MTSENQPGDNANSFRPQVASDKLLIGVPCPWCGHDQFALGRLRETGEHSYRIEFLCHECGHENELALLWVLPVQEPKL